jgi:hypothetical protein
MNENLKTLSDEAYIFAEQYSIYSPTLLQCYTEKFAQLIIKECSKICLDPNNWYEDAAGETFSVLIKQKFGIE